MIGLKLSSRTYFHLIWMHLKNPPFLVYSGSNASKILKHVPVGNVIQNQSSVLVMECKNVFYLK